LELTRGSALGYAQGEAGTFAWFALRFDFAPVGSGDLMGYAQAESRAGLGAGWIRTVEAFEHEWELLLGYADTGV
jgi:hypothetical protein